MALQEQLEYLGMLVDAVSLVPFALPALLGARRQGAIWRKAALVAATAASAWLLSVGLFGAVVIPSLWGNRLLATTINSGLEPSTLLLLLKRFTESIASHWFFAGQVLVPLVAAVSALPLAMVFCRKLLKPPVSSSAA